MSHVSEAPLKALMQTLNDGIAFYRTAALKTDHESHRLAFEELGKNHELAKRYLQPYVVLQTGKAEEGHSFGGWLHHNYVELGAKHAPDDHHLLLKQLEQVENITIKDMNFAAASTRNSLVKVVIKGLLPQIHKCRERVLSLADFTDLPSA